MPTMGSPGYIIECSCCRQQIDIAVLIASHLVKMAQRYPAEIFGAEGATYDGVAGTALRVVLTQEAKRLRGEG